MFKSSLTNRPRDFGAYSFRLKTGIREPTSVLVLDLKNGKKAVGSERCVSQGINSW